MNVIGIHFYGHIEFFICKPEMIDYKKIPKFIHNQNYTDSELADIYIDALKDNEFLPISYKNDNKGKYLSIRVSNTKEPTNINIDYETKDDFLNDIGIKE